MTTPQEDETQNGETSEEANEDEETTESEAEETEEKIDIKRVDFKELIENDLLKANAKTAKMVKAAKSNIADLANFCNKDHVKRESATPLFSGAISQSRIDSEKLIKQGIKEAQEKAATDFNVIHFYDKALAHEIQDHIKTDVLDKGLTIVKKKTQMDFQNTQEHTDNLVTETKSTVENFINTVSENAAKDEASNISPSDIASEMWQKMKNKAEKDFKESNENAQKLSSKTRLQIRENMNPFLENPSGRKSQEEIEEIVKQKTNEFSEKVKDDILREKFQFSRAVEEARGSVGLNSLFPKNADEDLNTNRTKLIKLYDKTKTDFKEVNEKVQEDVTTLKEHIDIDNIQNEITLSGNEDVPDVLNKFPEIAQADFKETNVKIQENVKDLKLKISQGMALKDDPESSEKQKEVSKIIENSINEFQEMAKNDFQKRNEKVMDTVSTAKSKIDESVNKLKDNLFFKGL